MKKIQNLWWLIPTSLIFVGRPVPVMHVSGQKTSQPRCTSFHKKIACE